MQKEVKIPNVYIPSDIGFPYKQCKKLYKKYIKLLDDKREFRDLVKQSFFYAFCDDNENLMGCIYYYYEGERLYVNAFAKRHTHLINIATLKETFTWFDCDIYARSVLKTSILCLLRCGFKKIGENLYKRSK